MLLIRHQQGFVLVLVLGLLTVFFIMALSLGAAVRADLARSRHLQDEVAAEFLAQAGIEWTIHYLRRLERQKSLWQAPWQWQPALFRAHRLGQGSFRLTYIDSRGREHPGLQDEEARLNVNTAPASLLSFFPGLTAAEVAAIVEARRQRPFATPEELLTRGVLPPDVYYGKSMLAGLVAYVTVWGSGKINVNTAPRRVLGALPGMTPALVEAVLVYRRGADGRPGTSDDRHFRDLDVLRRVLGVDQTTMQRWQPLMTVVPTAFRVIVTGRMTARHGRARTHRRLAIIERAGKSVRLQYWRRLE